MAHTAAESLNRRLCCPVALRCLLCGVSVLLTIQLARSSSISAAASHPRAMALFAKQHQYLLNSQPLWRALALVFSSNRGLSSVSSTGHPAAEDHGPATAALRKGVSRDYSTHNAGSQAPSPTDSFGPLPALPQRRVVVTGLGMVTPLGVGVSSSWQRLLKGDTGVRRLQAEDMPEVCGGPAQ